VCTDAPLLAQAWPLAASAVTLAFRPSFALMQKLLFVKSPLLHFCILLVRLGLADFRGAMREKVGV